MRWLSLFLCTACARPAPPTSARLGDDLQVRKLADRVWVHTAWKDLPGIGPFPSNGLVVLAPRGVVLIDTAWTPEQTRRLVAWIEPALGARVTDVVVTHSHDDRVGGLPAVSGATVWALPLTAKRADIKARPVPEAGALDLAGERVEILYPGPAHALDNIVVYLPRVGVLFGGCMVRAQAARDLGNPADADPNSWKQAIAKVMASYGAARAVVPGHGDPGGTELLVHTQELITPASPAR
jgi:metallo-beta-lactamase class B